MATASGADAGMATPRYVKITFKHLKVPCVQFHIDVQKKFSAVGESMITPCSTPGHFLE